MQLRRRIGKNLIRLGMWVHGPFDKVVLTDDRPLKEALDLPLDAVVEAEDTPMQWSEHQTGNVIVAEPDLITLHRRGKL
jgi:hypothetical protein